VTNFKERRFLLGRGKIDSWIVSPREKKQYGVGGIAALVLAALPLSCWRHCRSRAGGTAALVLAGGTAARSYKAALPLANMI